MFKRRGLCFGLLLVCSIIFLSLSNVYSVFADNHIWLENNEIETLKITYMATNLGSHNDIYQETLTDITPPHLIIANAYLYGIVITAQKKRGFEL